jgi:hypothetical protein
MGVVQRSGTTRERESSLYRLFFDDTKILSWHAGVFLSMPVLSSVFYHPPPPLLLRSFFMFFFFFMCTNKSYLNFLRRYNLRHITAQKVFLNQ